MTNGITPENSSGDEFNARSAELEMRELINRQTGTFTATINGPDGQAKIVGGEDVLGLPSARGYGENDETQVIPAVITRGRTIPASNNVNTLAPDDAMPYTFRDKVGNYFRERKGKLGLACAGLLLAGTGIACSDEVSSLLDRNKAEEINPGVVSDEEWGDNFEASLHGIAPDIDRDDILIGNDVKVKNNKREASPTSSFVGAGEIVENCDELKAFLGSDDPKAKAARAAVEKALADRPDELARALNCEGYVLTQFKGDIGIIGNAGLKDGEAIVDMNHVRKAAGYDMFWFFTDVNGNIVKGATIRADCGNPNIEKIIPGKPKDVTPTIPVTRPPSTPPTITLTTIPKKPPTTTSRVEECPPGSVKEQNRCVHKEITDGHTGPAAQRDTDPGSTLGYKLGNAETVVEQQDKEKPGGLDPTQYGTQAGGPGTSPRGGGSSVVSKPDPSAPGNPGYKPGIASIGTDEGTGDDADSNATKTEGTGQTSSGDSGMPK